MVSSTSIIFFSKIILQQSLRPFRFPLQGTETFFTIKKGIFLPLRLSCKESSTFSPSPSSIVFTTPSIPLLGDRNLRKRGCNRPTRCSGPLRSKVGGPSKVCARFCGMGPPGYSLLIGTARIVPHCSIALHLSPLE